MKTELEEIKLTVKDLENTVNQLKKEIENLEKKESGKRKRLQNYYKIRANGEIDIILDVDDADDRYFFKSFNYFATEQEAIDELNRRNLVNEFRAFVEEELCEVPIDWSDNQQKKRYLYYNVSNNIFENTYNICINYGFMCWTNPNGFDKIMQKFSKDQLKTILGVK